MTEQTYVCPFCKCIYKDKYVLKRHQSTAKFCLQIQSSDISIAKYKCNNCNYKSMYKHNYERHLKKCTIVIDQKMKEENISIKKELEFVTKEKDTLWKELTKSRARPNNINNTIINNINHQYNISKKLLQPYEYLSNNFESIINSNLNRQHFMEGVKGVIRFIVHDLLTYDGKKYYASYTKGDTDFHRITDGEVEIDEKAKKLLNDIYPYIEDRCKEIRQDEEEPTFDITNASNSELRDKQKQRLKLCSKYKEIQRLGIQGSDEYNECVRRISREHFISKSVSATEKSIGKSSKDENIITIEN